MVSPYQLVQELCCVGFGHGSGATLLLQGGRLLSWGHRWTWLARRGRLYANSDNWLMMGCGIGLERVAGDYAVVQIAAQLLALAARVDESVKLWHSLEDDIGVLRRHYSRPLVPSLTPWRDVTHGRWLSPSMALRLREQWCMMRRWWWRTAILVWSLARHLLELLSVLKEAYDTACWDPAVSRDNVRAIFLNAFGTLDTVVKEGDALVAALRRRSDVVDDALALIEAPFCCEELVDKIDDLVAAAKKVHGVVDPWRQRFGGLATDLLKGGISGTLATLGLLEALPDSLCAAVALDAEEAPLPVGMVDDVLATRPSRRQRSRTPSSVDERPGSRRQRRIDHFKTAMKSVNVEMKWQR